MAIEELSPINVAEFERLLEIFASRADVHQDVRDNYWNNRWWPTNITDWRLKIFFSGLSTRVSYNAIGTYCQVRDTFSSLGYDGMKLLSEKEFVSITRPLGLPATRWRLWQSVVGFVSSFPDSAEVPPLLQQQTNDELIEYLCSNIRGVGYKVAQGSALYIRGYHCGIIPVDSGMKDHLGPALGLRTSSGPSGHELMRKHLESLAQEIDYPRVMTNSNFDEISQEMQEGDVNTWWVHLVLIYFKRRFCNKHELSKCPLPGIRMQIQADLINRK